MKTAIIHDWLTGMRGGEKVLEALCGMFPEADIYTLICDSKKISEIIKSHKIRTSFLQRFPGIYKYYRNLLPVFPFAVERFNLKTYDFIISSSHCVAKGAIPAKGAFHACYCHTPMRYAWEQFDQYFSPGKSGRIKFFLISKIMPYLRTWDIESSGRVNYFIANSENVKERIKKHYGRDAQVIYPPVDTDFYNPGSPQAKKENFFLMVSALTEYKKVDFAINLFNKLQNEKLIIAGTGPMLKKLKKLIKYGNIEMAGYKTDEEIRDYYRRAKAFIFPGEEDFGITMVEAQACGTPVLAFFAGGALEIVKEGITGEFFDGTEEGFIKKLEKIKNKSYDLKDMIDNAAKFSKENFKNKVKEFLAEHKVNNR